MIERGIITHFKYLKGIMQEKCYFLSSAAIFIPTSSSQRNWTESGKADLGLRRKTSLVIRLTMETLSDTDVQGGDKQPANHLEMDSCPVWLYVKNLLLCLKVSPMILRIVGTENWRWSFLLLPFSFFLKTRTMFFAFNFFLKDASQLGTISTGPKHSKTL